MDKVFHIRVRLWTLIWFTLMASILTFCHPVAAQGYEPWGDDSWSWDEQHTAMDRYVMSPAPDYRTDGAHQYRIEIVDRQRAVAGHGSDDAALEQVGARSKEPIALPEVARVRREVEALGLLLQHDAVNGA